MLGPVNPNGCRIGSRRLARCDHIVARRHHHEVGLSQSSHRTLPICVLITSIEIMRIQAIVFGKRVGGKGVDAGAEGVMVEGRGRSGSLGEGMMVE